METNFFNTYSPSLYIIQKKFNIGKKKKKKKTLNGEITKIGINPLKIIIQA